MQIFKKIYHKKTQNFSFENLLHCFWRTLYFDQAGHLRSSLPVLITAKHKLQLIYLISIRKKFTRMSPTCFSQTRKEANSHNCRIRTSIWGSRRRRIPRSTERGDKSNGVKSKLMCPLNKPPNVIFFCLSFIGCVRKKISDLKLVVQVLAFFRAPWQLCL